MRKPDNYDQSEAIEGGFREPHAGPCILGIVKADVQKNRNGEQQLVLFLDIADGEFKNYYRRQTERFNKSRYLRFYQNTEGKGLPHFKGIIRAIEEANPGFTFDWNESSLSRKKIGGNLRDEEYVRTNDGTIGTSLRVAYLCSIKSIEAGEHKVLPVRKLAPQQSREPGVDDIPPEDYSQVAPYDEPLPF
jgi:hypothetical protein